MKYTALCRLTLLLFLLWLLLSWHFSPLLLGLGFVSATLVATLSLRMQMYSPQDAKLNISRLLRYACWLVIEIIKAGITVCRCIIKPSQISPKGHTILHKQQTPLGQLIYANSITLTPGTITIGVADDTLAVHALQQSGADELVGGEMERRINLLTWR